MELERLIIAKDDIIEYFDSHIKNIFKRNDFKDILDSKRDFWRVSNKTSAEKFISFLLDNTKLKKISFNFPSRKEIRYTWGQVFILKLLNSIKDKSYFSHYSAVFIHELSTQIPTTIYINIEQPPKRIINPELKQENIDLAFSRKVRVSKNIAKFNKQKICLLNGKYTNNMGVIDKFISNENIRVTSIERTLIDIAVRPIYCGGVFEVLNVYKNAHSEVSINKLAALLKNINYIYPYHQVIGFYLDRTGVYKKDQIRLIDKIPKKYDFYLTHKIEKVEYDRRWKLFYPKGF